MLQVTTNPILELLDPLLPYPALLANKSTDVDVPDSDDIPLMMSDFEQVCPLRTSQEISQQARQTAALHTLY
jgi:hypothetical protein